MKPGQKLCASCRNKILKTKQNDQINVDSSLNTQDEDVTDAGLTTDELLQLKKKVQVMN
jgi:hypothetical protein